MEEMVPEESSMAGQEGTAAHFLASECLSKNKNPETCHHFGIKIIELANGFAEARWSSDPLPEGAIELSQWKVDTEMVKAITEYVDFVTTKVKGGRLFVEQRVDFGDGIGYPGAFGTSDVIILSEDGEELTVIDLKYGYQEVSAEENPQMLLYALGAIAGLKAGALPRPPSEEDWA